MKKISALAIAGVFTASLAATAFAEMAEVKVGGEIRVRAEQVKSDEYSSEARIIQRTRLNVDAKVNETTKAYLSLQDSRQWGDERLGNQYTDSVAANATSDTAAENQAVDISQAYFQLDQLAGQPLSLRIGRQAMAYGEHRLIGSFEWSNHARRFDAIKAMYNIDAFSVDLWTAKVIEGNSSASDSDFNGIYATLKTIPNNTLDIYLLQDKSDKNADHASGGDSATASDTPSETAALDDDRDIKTYGARLNGNVVGLDYTAEIAKQTGDDVDGTDADTSSDDIDTLAYAVRAGYTIPNTPSLRIGAEYAYASGDDTANDGDQEKFQNLYPTNHPLYGFTDDIGWSNIKAWSINASLKPAKGLWIGAEYWNYTAAEDVTVAGQKEDDLGTEINVMARYALNDAVSLEAAWVRRESGDAYTASKDYAGNAFTDDGDVSDFTYLQANVKF